MGKASREKRQKESRAKPISKEKCLESGETSSKWSVFRNPLFHLILITIIGIIAYSNTFHVPFHFDDTNNIVENYKLKDLSNFWAPAGSRWFGFLTFALNYHFGGLDTFGYHIVNLTIHIINAILIYFLVVLTFKTPYFKVSVISASVSNQPNQFNLSTFKPLNYLPLFIALLFVSHPIQTQAVTYIVQRFTSLATLFCLLSLVMYIKWRLRIEQQTSRATEQQGNKATGKNYWATGLLLYCSCIASAILAMKTKEISFTLPFIIILYEFSFFKNVIARDSEGSEGIPKQSKDEIPPPLQRTRNDNLWGYFLKRLLYLTPFLLTLLIIPLSLIGIDKPIGDVIGELREAAQETEEIPRWSYLFTQFRVIVTYIRLLFLPINQNLDYDYPVYNSFFDPEVFLSFLFLLSIFGFGVYLFYRSQVTVQGSQSQNSELKTLRLKPEATSYTLHPTRLIAFGIFWFFIALSVESSIIPIRDVIFEHRVYLPSVGFFIALIVAIEGGLARWGDRAVYTKKAVVYVMIPVMLSLSVATYARNALWQDSVRLWGNAVEGSPNKARPHFSLGLAYADQGKTDEAINEYQIALKLKFDYAEPYNNLGLAYFDQGKTDEAINEYQIALKLKFDYAEPHNNLGIAYGSLGRSDEAIKEYQTALKINPDYAEAHYNLGIAYFDQGRSDEAIKEFKTALKLKPDFAEIHYNLGVAYFDQGRSDEAIKEFKIALKLKPDFTQAHQSLVFLLKK